MLDSSKVIWLKKIYLFQIMITFLALCSSFIFSTPKNSVRMLETILSFVIIIFGLKIPNTSTKKKEGIRKFLFNINSIFQIVGQFICLPLGLASVILLLHSIIGIPYEILSVFALLYLLFLYIPTTYFIAPRFKSTIARIIILMFIIFFEVGGGSQLALMFTTPNEIGQFIQNINVSQSINALAIILNVSLAMKLWGFDLPNFSISNESSFWINIVLFILMIWFVIWNGFGNGHSLISGYNFVFNSITVKDILMPIESISEEWIFRFGVLTLTLRALSHNKNGIIISVFLNGLLFGLWHLTNVLSTSSSSGVLQQVILAVGIGSIFSAIYLYTKNLGFTILIHFLMNFIAFTNMNGNIVMHDPSTLDWVLTAFWLLLFILVAYYLVTGNRKEMIKHQLHIVK